MAWENGEQSLHCYHAPYLADSVFPWRMEWMAKRPKVAKKDEALRFGILGAANIAYALIYFLLK
jgi:hypothetical protein